MRTLITLFAVGLLSACSLAQNDLNIIVEDYMTRANLDLKKLEKLEAIRTNTSMDSLKREKKWEKAYQKWDKQSSTASFLTAGTILCNIGPNAAGYRMNRDYSSFSNQYLNYLLDQAEERPDSFSKQTTMFLRSALKRRKDVSQELVNDEFELIFVEINRFAKDTPITSNHFAVMSTYLQSTHPEAKNVQDLVKVLSGYNSEQLEKLIQHAEKNGLSLNQLNTVPPLRKYSSDLTLGRMFRRDVLKVYQLFRHAYGAHDYRTADSWSEDRFEMYHHYLDNPDIRNMVVGMTCYKRWLEHEYGKLNASKMGEYIDKATGERVMILYDELQKSQIKQLMLNLPSNKYTKDPFIQLLIAADNGIFFLPTDINARFVGTIENLKVNKNFELSKKERTVVDAIGPYRIKYQGERILKDREWLTEHAKNPKFRLAVFLKLAQTAMQSETDWFEKAKDYRSNPFASMPEPVSLPPSEEELKKKADRLTEIKKALEAVIEEEFLPSGKYVITCEGKKNVEIYPIVPYGSKSRITWELKKLKVESLMQYGFPGYSRFIVYVNEKEPEPLEEIVEMDFMDDESMYAVPPPPVPPAPSGKEEIVKEAEIIDFPDVEASFPGGARNLKHWIDNNLQYPEFSQEMNDQGRVYVSFVVEVNGSITNVKVERGITPELDRAAKRLVRSMPKWTPGEAKGRKVRTRCRVPIVFSL